MYLKSSKTINLTAFVIEMFISCTRVLMCLPWSLAMSSSRLDSNQDGQYASLRLLCTFHIFIKVSTDPPETKKLPNFI